MMWRNCIMFIGFSLQLADVLYASEKDVSEYSRCAFPCAWRGTVLIRLDGSRVANFTSCDHRHVTVTTNTSTLDIYCIERAGPFYVFGYTNNGVNSYACFKDTLYDPDYAIIVSYATTYEPFYGRPDVCEICNGTGLELAPYYDSENGKDCKIVIPKELGCNIPWFCTVTDPEEQVQCSPCEPYEEDDGLCCDREEK